MSSNEWKELYCVESHGCFIKGEKYLVRKIATYTAEVKIRGKIIYEDPRYFQVNKPFVKVEEEEEEYDEFI